MFNNLSEMMFEKLPYTSTNDNMQLFRLHCLCYCLWTIHTVCSRISTSLPRPAPALRVLTWPHPHHPPCNSTAQQLKKQQQDNDIGLQYYTWWWHDLKNELLVFLDHSWNVYFLNVTNVTYWWCKFQKIKNWKSVCLSETRKESHVVTDWTLICY